MGEYFCVFLKKREGNTIRYFPKVDVKLMEFCWHKTVFSMFMNSMLYKNPMHMAVVGDEITREEIRDMIKVFGRDQVDHTCNRKDTGRMFLYGKKIVNHTKKEYVDYDEYALRSENRLQLVTNPLFFLTLYKGSYLRGRMPQAGVWNSDLVSIEDEAPEGYEKKDYSFRVEMNGYLTPNSGLIEGPVGGKNLERTLNSEFDIVEELATDLGWYVGGYDDTIRFEYLNSQMDSNIELPVDNLFLNMIEKASYEFESPVREQFIELVKTLIEENNEAKKIAEFYDLPAGGK